MAQKKVKNPWSTDYLFLQLNFSYACRNIRKMFVNSTLMFVRKNDKNL